MEGITLKSTKETIYQALKEANTKIKELEKIKNNPQAEIKQKHNTETIVQAETIVSEKSLAKHLSELNTAFSTAINEGIDKYNKAMENIATVNDAIELKQQELEELYQIEKEFLKFSDVVNAQMDEKEKFEEQFKELKEKHQQELDDIKQQLVEAKERLKNESLELKKELELQHKKEVEEYDYNIKRKRKLEEDSWTDEVTTRRKELELEIHTKKEEMNKEQEKLNEREEALTKREAKMTELEQKIEDMPNKIKEAVDKAVEEAEKAAKRSYTFETTILKKDYEGKINLLESKIETLNSNALKDAEAIKELQARLNDSYKEIKDMAAKSVEGASNQKAYTTIESTLKNLQKHSEK